MARTTIKDIARIAGVSVTTVSRALNDAPEIRPETRERILRICREQGFRINYLARSLVSSRTHVLGVVLPDLSGPFHAALSLHLERYARERGYQILLCCGRPGDDRIDDLFAFLVSQRVDGILLVSASSAAQELLPSRAQGIPSVLLGDVPPEASCRRINAVSTDNYVGGATAVALADVLARLATTRQVIVVTHLAQVAVVAERHYLVEKRAGEAGVPETTLTEIAGEDRVAEIARMLSGDTGAASRDLAREMLAGASRR